jgi:hypothetical protein
VINVTMSEQYSRWSQPISLDNLVDALLSVLPGVDNQALLTWPGRKQVAVGGERASGEPGYQHSALIGGGPPGHARASRVRPGYRELVIRLVRVRQDTGWAQLGLER